MYEHLDDGFTALESMDDRGRRAERTRTKWCTSKPKPCARLRTSAPKCAHAMPTCLLSLLR